jgi:hypothetical protein
VTVLCSLLLPFTCIVYGFLHTFRQRNRAKVKLLLLSCVLLESGELLVEVLTALDTYIADVVTDVTTKLHVFSSSWE